MRLGSPSLSTQQDQGEGDAADLGGKWPPRGFCLGFGSETGRTGVTAVGLGSSASFSFPYWRLSQDFPTSCP